MAYKSEKKFEWDKAKNDACLQTRGFDFGHAARVFQDPSRIVVPDKRFDYGEDRYQVMGSIERRLYVIVFTMRGTRIRIISARKANSTLDNMNTIRMTIDPDDPGTSPKGIVDYTKVDATTDAEIARQQQEDDEEAMQEMARYARRVRRRLGLTQTELARRINVPRETIRNWEQGKRGPTGAARSLLRILDKAPETALSVLT